MKVLTFTTQKGGPGKTTLAASVGVAAMQDGQRVLLLDTDPQASLHEWFERRKEADEALEVHRIDAADLDRVIKSARAAGGADLVIVDTPGAFGTHVALALQVADFCLLPIRTSVLDVTAAKPTIEQLQRMKKAFGFCLNQVQPGSTSRNADTAAMLIKSTAQMPPMIGQRSDFYDAMLTGQGVTEFAPKGKAAAEIRVLYQWVNSQLQGVQHV